MSNSNKWPATLLLCGAGLLVMLPLQPGWKSSTTENWVTANVAGTRLRIDPETAGDLRVVERLALEFAPGNSPFLTAPYWPGAYAALERKSPVWEIYALYPRSEAFQKAEIERIEATRPGFAFLIDAPLDGLENRRFRHTHPLLYRYILDHFQSIKGYSANTAYRVYKSKL
jgi:hypothetical protein